jgi:hypothetical protein
MASQLSIRVVEWNDTLDIARWIENPNLARAKARAVLCIIHCLIFFGNTGSTPGRFKSFPAQRCGLISITVIVFNERVRCIVG